MLTRAELLLLAGWCRARNMTWAPGRPRAGTATVLLERSGRRADAMLLVVETAERRLLDADGQELAAASDLPALLDAVDGGVGDVAAFTTWLPTRAITAATRSAA